MNLFTEQKQNHRHRKQTYGYQEEREWDKFEIWDSQTHTIIHKTDKQQDLLLSPGNYI